jgi:hypothetical protein
MRLAEAGNFRSGNSSRLPMTWVEGRARRPCGRIERMEQPARRRGSRRSDFRGFEGLFSTPHASDQVWKRPTPTRLGSARESGHRYRRPPRFDNATASRRGRRQQSPPRATHGNPREGRTLVVVHALDPTSSFLSMPNTERLADLMPAAPGDCNGLLPPHAHYHSEPVGHVRSFSLVSSPRPHYSRRS